MKKSLAILCVGLSLTGCHSKGANAPATRAPLQPDTVAIVNGKSITMDQLQKPLIEGYGLNVLFNLVQLEIAKQTAAKNFIVVTEADFQSEMDQTLASMNTENNVKPLAEIDAADAKGDKELAEKLRKEMLADNNQVLERLLQEKRLSHAEYELVIRTNAYLRKIVEPTLKDAITDKMLEDGFRFQYGEKVLVRHIQCANWAEIAEAKTMLAKGTSFEDVAKALSRNARTAPLGGELRPFSRAEPGLSDAFKDAAFSLKEGEISDAVIVGTSFQLIKLEKRLPPTAVKFEHVKDAIRRDLYQGLLTNGISQLRVELKQDAVKTLNILEPTLKAQYDKQMRDAKSQVQGKEETRKKWTEEREAAAKAMATQPTSAPAAATMPASVPATAPAAK